MSARGKWKFKASRQEDHQLLGKDSNNVLFMESPDSLPVFYAKDMLSTFMWAAIEALNAPIWGTTSIRESEAGESRDQEEQFSLTNSNINRLAQAIQGPGLLGERDAYLSIILPLSMQNKLPDAPSRPTL
ncbi:hypothetical protein HDV57DRAFT_517152 [Trichoderma longibrachiatum]